MATGKIIVGFKLPRDIMGLMGLNGKTMGILRFLSCHWEYEWEDNGKKTWDFLWDLIGFQKDI